MNVRGLAEKTKRQDVFNWLKQKNTPFSVYKMSMWEKKTEMPSLKTGVGKYYCLQSKQNLEVLQYFLIKPLTIK